MIIRKTNNTFVMTEQHYHAQISAEIVNHWVDHFLKGDPQIDSILYAIKNHDIGWDLFDKQPFWNELTNAPYSFIDFPILPKIALYTYGVDLVEKNDPYAAALCSAHYVKFMQNHSNPEVNNYLIKEKKRQQRILMDLPAITPDIFDMHLAILQFADNISLYLCLNEPGLIKSETHYFFQEGIPISPKINKITTPYIEAEWLDQHTLRLKGLPSVPSFSVSLKQKNLTTQQIEKDGLIKSYQTTPYENYKMNCIINTHE